jgi:hypothetical protein
MNTIFCPLCQVEIANIQSVNSVCELCKGSLFKETGFYSPFFMFSIMNDEIHNYQINIEVDGNLYGFDSYKYTAAHTNVLLFKDARFSTLAKFNYFTPVPKNQEDLKRYIRRLTNLKAFI